MLLRRGTSADLAAVVNLQFAAYARNRTILGVEPIPLQADYTDILATMEVWLAESEATSFVLAAMSPSKLPIAVFSSLVAEASSAGECQWPVSRGGS